MVAVRPIEEADAEGYVALLQRLDVESRFPVVGFFERVMGAAQWRIYIARMKKEGSHEDFVAEDRGQLVGFLSTTRSDYAAVHQLRIVIGILQSHTGQGIGTRLFVAVESWARCVGIQRLELLVEDNNARAIALYVKMGFTFEGVIERAVRIDGDWVDDLLMAKWLGEERDT